MTRLAALLLLCTISAPLFGATKRAVAVTFDDLPDINAEDDSVSEQEAITRLLLDALRRNHIPAIGFVNEDKLMNDDEEPDPRRVALLAAWLDGGFDIGNHTYSHSDLNEVGPAKFEEDILRGEVITRPMMQQRGLTLRWFRHPYLDTGSRLAERDQVNAFLAAHNYRVAPVTVDNSEWIYHLAYLRARFFQRPMIRRSYINYMRERFRFAESRSRLVFGCEVPQVLLLHAGALNAETFDALAAMMRERGYEFVDLDHAVADHAYSSADCWAGGGVTWLERWGVAKKIPEERFEDDPKVPRWIQRIAGAKDE